MKNKIFQISILVIVLAIGVAIGSLNTNNKQPNQAIRATEQQRLPVQAQVQTSAAISANLPHSVITHIGTENSRRADITPSANIKPQTPASSNASSSPKINIPTEINDELIDRSVAAPFNQIVKERLVNEGGGEGDKARLKRFVLAGAPDDWDLAMQNHLYDGIISHPLAKFITVQSINCKAHVCELQIYDSNTGSWPQIVADLSEQPWWDFQLFSTYSFVAMVDLQRRNADYVLLGKTP